MWPSIESGVGCRKKKKKKKKKKRGISLAGRQTAQVLLFVLYG